MKAKTIKCHEITITLSIPERDVEPLLLECLHPYEYAATATNAEKLGVLMAHQLMTVPRIEDLRVEIDGAEVEL